jgi:hypothetical protein
MRIMFYSCNGTFWLPLHCSCQVSANR